MIVLNHCRRCGSANVRLVEDSKVIGHNERGFWFYVGCNHCYLKGEERHDYVYGSWYDARLKAQEDWGFTVIADPLPVYSDKPLVEDPYVVIARQLSEDKATREKRQRRGRLIECVAKAMYQARRIAHEDESEAIPNWEEIDFERLPFRTMATAAVNMLVPE